MDSKATIDNVGSFVQAFVTSAPLVCHGRSGFEVIETPRTVCSPARGAASDFETTRSPAEAIHRRLTEEIAALTAERNLRCTSTVVAWRRQSRRSMYSM